MTTNLTLSITEIVSIIIAVGGLVSVWIAASVKIAKIETTMNLKIAGIEMKIADLITTNTKQMDDFIKANQVEHSQLLHDSKNIRLGIMALAMGKPVPEASMLG